MLYLKALGAGVLLALAVPGAYLLTHVAYTTWVTLQALTGPESSFDVSSPLRLRPSLLGFVLGFSWMLWRGKRRGKKRVG